MITKLRIPPLLLTALVFASCEKLWLNEEPAADAKSTFDYLWQQFDDQYAAFEVKSVDWDSAYLAIGSHIDADMSNEALFAECGKLLDMLHDGHVNLMSGFDTHHDPSVYRTMSERSNIDEQCVMLHYLRPDYHTISGFRYNDIGDNILYIYYNSFSNSADSSKLHYLINRFDKPGHPLQGIIIDVRQNGGGLIQNIWNILSLFRSEGQLLYTTQAKKGPGHGDFGSPTTVTAPINPNGLNYKVVVLTDRGSFSATSFFALCAKEYDNFRVIGDTTSGGLGLPRNGQLPNGWYYRLSSTRTLSADGYNYENGVPPDEVVLLDRTLSSQGVDNVIERARQWLIAP